LDIRGRGFQPGFEPRKVHAELFIGGLSQLRWASERELHSVVLSSMLAHIQMLAGLPTKMTYWREVAGRAWRQAVADLRLGGMSVAVSFAVQAVIGLALLIGLGASGANWPTRAASFAAPFLILPLVWLVRMGTMPPVIDSERKVRITELETEREAQMWALIGGDNARQHAHLRRLRDAYKYNAEGVPSDVMGDEAWPPIDWLNAALEKDQMAWRVDRIEGLNVFTRSAKSPS
jgi:hypothetical protein